MSKTSTKLKAFTTSAFLVGLTACSIVFASNLALDHMKAMTTALSLSTPLVQEIPSLEKKALLLQEQVELSELTSAIQPNVLREYVYAYVLPQEVDIDRTLSFLDIIREHFTALGVLQDMSSVEFGQKEITNDDVSFVPIIFSLSLQKEAVAQIVSLFDMAGVITIADLFSHEELQAIVDPLEAKNSAGITHLEKFVSTDLRTYVSDKKATVAALRRAYGGEELTQFLQTIDQSNEMKKVQRAFSNNFASVLQEHALWPLPLLTIDSLQFATTDDPDTVRLNFAVRMYERGK
jgi:hypothetical protein